MKNKKIIALRRWRAALWQTVLMVSFFGSVYADADSIALPKLIVHSDKLKSDHAATADGVTAKFNKKQINDQGASSLTNFLSKQSLVQIKTHSPQQNQSMISIHGFGQNALANTLLLIDGVPVTAFSNIGPNLNSVIVDNIDSITILPGSYGSLYGDQAVGGVVNLQTHVPAKRQAMLGFGLGNHNQKQGNFFYSERFPSHIGVSLGGLAYHNDHYQPNNQQTNYNINAKVDYIGESDSVSLNLLSYKTYIEMPNGRVWGQSDLPEPGTNYDNIKGAVVYLKNRWLINPDWQWQTNLVTVANQVDGKFRQADSQNDDNGVLLQNSWSYKKYLLTGFDLQHSNYQSKNLFVDNSAAEDVADLFGRVKLPLKQRLKLVLGVRLAKQWINAQSKTQVNTSDQSGVFVNEQGLIWQQTPQLKLYLRRDTNYRFAKGNEKIWVDSNVKNLKTQTGTSYESGFSWHRAADLFSLGVYWLDLNNELAYDTKPVAGGPFGSLSNLPPTRRLGVDMVANMYLKQRVAMNLQLNAVKATIRSGMYQGNQIPDVSPFSAGVGVTYLNYKQWTLHISETYDSDFYAADDLGNEGNKMPGYFLTNLNIRKRWQMVTFNLRVDNLFNKHYVRYADYYSAIPPSGSFPGMPAQILYYPADGITVLFTTEVSLT